MSYNVRRGEISVVYDSVVGECIISCLQNARMCCGCACPSGNECFVVTGCVVTRCVMTGCVVL